MAVQSRIQATEASYPTMSIINPSVLVLLITFAPNVCAASTLYCAVFLAVSEGAGFGLARSY